MLDPSELFRNIRNGYCIARSAHTATFKVLQVLDTLRIHSTILVCLVIKIYTFSSNMFDQRKTFLYLLVLFSTGSALVSCLRTLDS